MLAKTTYKRSQSLTGEVLCSLIGKLVELTGRVGDKTRSPKLGAGILEQRRIRDRLRLVHNEVVDAVDLLLSPRVRLGLLDLGRDRGQLGHSHCGGHVGISGVNEMQVFLS